MGSDDLIDFEVIENQKENIQSLPSGRSARALAQLYTPPLSGAGQAPSPLQTQDEHNEARQEFEKELQAIDESDDPLDVYDRYVKWTLDAYPSAQNTPQSQLCPLLERATKAFQGSSHYQNDPRYLKLWLHYIRLFSDAPRETFAYLARHNIGDKLALYYEEFAAWLETAGRWTQAEEVYSLGIEKEARPVERLIRKYGEFQHRFESRPQDSAEHTSPALPAVRPALAAKVDPFSLSGSPDPQAQSRAQTGSSSTRSGKPKLAIFSDGDEAPKPGSSGSSKGWDSIGSLADRKKENKQEARSWAGETMKVGKKNTGVQKMMIFKDETSIVPNNEPSKPHPLRSELEIVNPRTGRVESVFVSLEQVYPRRGAEYSFEELRAKYRGWMDMDWAAIRKKEQKKASSPVLVDLQPDSAAPKASPAPQEPNASTNNIASLANVDLAPKPIPVEEKQKKPKALQVYTDENAAPQTHAPPAETEKPSKKFQVHADDQASTSQQSTPTASEGPKKSAKAFEVLTDEEPKKASKAFEVLPDEEQKKASKAFEVLPDEEPKMASKAFEVLADEGPQEPKKAFEVLADEEPRPQSTTTISEEFVREAPKVQTVPLKGSIEDELDLNDENAPPSRADVDKARAAKKARREERANRTRKIKVMEVKEIRGETQTIQTNLDSPTGRKIRRKKGREATMTLHTKEAMDEIYDIFNEPLKEQGDTIIEESEEESSDGDGDDDDDEDDYTSAGESTGTGHLSCATSEFGDETTVADFTLGTTIGDDEDDGSEADDTDTKSVSAWSEFTEQVSKGEEHSGSEDEGEGSEGDSFSEISPEHVHAEEQSEGIVTPTSPGLPSHSLPTRYVPVPPEDYDVPTRPYRDPAIAANNRLPFMTPIVEKTESSLGIVTAHAQKEYFNAKTPSRSKGAVAVMEDDDEPWSSPFRESIGSSDGIPGKVTKLALREAKSPRQSPTGSPRKPLGEVRPAAPVKEVTEQPKQKGPIIQDTQCNPVDETIRETILREIQPPLDSYDGYTADTECTFGKGPDIRKYTKAVSKLSGRTSSDKTATSLTVPPTLRFQGTDRIYTVKKELGKGAFAPVYLAESTLVDEEENDENHPAQMGKGKFGIQRNSLEALKMEEPPSAWEFYIMRQAKRRLGVSRAADSVVHAYEMHMFKDECYLVEEFRDQGTLLDLVNIARAENGAMDEQLAMFFTVELLRTVEALHSKGLIHGDLKADNILVRFDSLPKEEQLESQYQRDGRDGWASKGITLIDFGRGIDMKAFKPDVQFIADWATTEADCAEMRELRPWTYQIDYHGLAGTIHSLLFGKYISTVAERAATLGAGATKTYRIKESLKRYWQTEIWQEAFDLLLNPLMHLDGEEGRKMPVSKGMKGVREKMELWLESNCEKGVGLKALVRRMEEAVKKR